MKSNFYSFLHFERNSLNRDSLDFCLNVKTFWLLFVSHEEKVKIIFLRDSVLQRGKGDPLNISLVVIIVIKHYQ